MPKKNKKIQKTNFAFDCGAGAYSGFVGANYSTDPSAGDDNLSSRVGGDNNNGSVYFGLSSPDPDITDNDSYYNANSSPPTGVGADNNDNNVSSSGARDSHYQRADRRNRRRYQRFIRDVKKQSVSFGGSRALLFNNFDRCLLKWPTSIHFTEKPTICFLFCDYVLKEKKIPVKLHPTNNPNSVNEYLGLTFFLRNINIAPNAFHLGAVNNNGFFNLYNSRLRVISPALISFYAFLQTFNRRVPEATGDSFFGSDYAFRYFCVGGTIDSPMSIVKEEEEQN